MTGYIHNSSTKGPDGLTELQRKFCEEYVKDYNGTQAYLRTSPEVRNDTARSSAYRLLKNQAVLNYIHKLQKQLAEAQCINAERIAMELSKIAFTEDKSISKTDKLKALSLLQKQFGLDQIKVSADVNQVIEIKVGIEDDTDKFNA